MDEFDDLLRFTTDLATKYLHSLPDRPVGPPVVVRCDRRSP